MFFKEKKDWILTFCFAIICLSISCGVEKDNKITLEEAKFENLAYHHDEDYGYFKGTGEYKDYRKKIQFDMHGHPVAIYQYATPAMDTLHGPWITFYATSKIQGSGYYINGKKVGPWKTYFDGLYKNKPFLSTEEYYVDGQLHGILNQYHENAQLFVSYNYEHGEKHGIMKKWFNDGTQWYEAHYDNGILLKQSEWYPNGVLKIDEVYENEQPLNSKMWDSNGTLRLQVARLKDKIVKTEFDENGIQISKTEE